MSWLRTLTIGCFCSREHVNIDDRKFAVHSRLGDGGFSVVDLVEELRTRRLYALKRLTCHSEIDKQLALDEVEYMRKFHHPNLVPCEAHAVIPVRNHRTAICQVAIVMPYYKNGSVHDELEMLRLRSQRIPEKKILNILMGLCTAIQALHSHNPRLAHRDIKPHNVMIAQDDTVVLMDFGSMGLARHDINGISEARALQDYASERCSMPYRAPELFQVDSYCTIDEKVDIWSLGCTLYAMCFYESPFDKVYQRGDSIALAAMAGNVQIPSDSVYSKQLTDIMLSMLCVNAHERPNIDVIIGQISVLASTNNVV